MIARLRAVARRVLHPLAAPIDRADGVWPYRVRPYDSVADARRWWFEPRALCGTRRLAALSPALLRAVENAVHHHARSAPTRDPRPTDGPRLADDASTLRRGREGQQP